MDLDPPVGDTYLFPSLNTQHCQNACNFYCNVTCQNNRIQLKLFSIIFSFSYICTNVFLSSLQLDILSKQHQLHLFSYILPT